MNEDVENEGIPTLTVIYKIATWRILVWFVCYSLLLYFSFIDPKMELSSLTSKMILAFIGLALFTLIYLSSKQKIICYDNYFIAFASFRKKSAKKTYYDSVKELIVRFGMGARVKFNSFEFIFNVADNKKDAKYRLQHYFEKKDLTNFFDLLTSKNIPITLFE